jgi:hypothetical protein
MVRRRFHNTYPLTRAMQFVSGDLVGLLVAELFVPSARLEARIVSSKPP